MKRKTKHTPIEPDEVIEGGALILYTPPVVCKPPMPIRLKIQIAATLFVLGWLVMVLGLIVFQVIRHAL
jgi:hypothetical protein